MKFEAFRIIRKIGKYSADYKALKADAEKRAVSGLFGRRAIYNTIGVILLLAAAIGFAALGFAALDTEGFVMTIVAVVALAAGAAAVVIAIVYEIIALVCACRQIRLNKRAIGLVSLIVNLVLVVAVIIAAVLLLSYVTGNL